MPVFSEFLHSKCLHLVMCSDTKHCWRKQRRQNQGAIKNHVQLRLKRAALLAKHPPLMFFQRQFLWG